MAFSVFVATETWLVPVEGWFVDRFGPRIVVALGGVLVACAWALNSVAGSLPMLYTGAALSGIGAGAVYGTCVGNALKWFPDRRGLAAGLTAAGFGAGTAATVIPIRHVILGLRLRVGVSLVRPRRRAVIVLLSCAIPARAAPGEAPKPAARLTQSLRDYTPLEMLRIADLLAALRHVRHGRGVGPDGDRADRADRRGLRARRRAGDDPVRRPRPR